MKFLDVKFNETPLYLSVQKENIEIIKLLLNHNKINIKIASIQKLIYF